MSKPELKLTGTDGNAFSLIGRARQAAKNARMGKETISKMTSEAMSGDYDNVLQTIMKYFDVS